MATTALTGALEACAHAAVGDRHQQPDGALRVGVDVVLVSDVADSIATFGSRYLDRIYSPRELADCAGDASRLAARFAVKEAVTKALAPSDAPGWWREIETVRSASGACELRLHGDVAIAAEDKQLSGWGISLTHEGDYSAAVVVGHRQTSARVEQTAKEKAA